MRLQSRDLLRSLMADARRKHSMSSLAAAAGCSKAFVSHLVAGRKTTCTPELAARIAEALAVDVDLLFVPSTPVDSGRFAVTSRRAAS